ncbi:MAG TPA: sodium:proton antiporter [Sumerlaeia bacterium]|nr:sodium:proton antiporter [Sumerlaeia bacterium]
MRGALLVPTGVCAGGWWILLLAIALLFLPAVAAPAPGGENASPSTEREAHDQGTLAAPASRELTQAERAAQESHDVAGGDYGKHHGPAPHLLWVFPFVALLLCIAILPLLPKTKHWWEKNSSKLAVAVSLAVVTCLYYLLRDQGFGEADRGLPSVLLVLREAVLADYVPFIVLLFSLYTISGGINLKGDVAAHPLTNTAFIATGTVLASFVGTTGAAMVLIRPLLQINSERRHVKHTAVFFIFLVCNIGGSLLPIGDPPLFLGYLRGVPFLWTLNLVGVWATCSLIVLAIYYVWDTIAYRTEEKGDALFDERVKVPLRLSGKRNFVLLLGVVLAVAFFVPGRKLPGAEWAIPGQWRLREIVLIVLALVSLAVTPKQVRKANDFNFYAIFEVACLFIGIFITMQTPVEILNIKGPELGLDRPWQCFWAAGALSSFLDNAPTYIVYFEMAGTLAPAGMNLMHGVQTATGTIPLPLLAAVSCGAVFMGANTYIGNGPNFMVKSIAEQSGVKMPTFLGYMAYSCGVLVPVFVLLTFVFFRG